EAQGEAAIRDRFPARPAIFAAKLADAYITAAAENLRSGLRALRAALSSQREARRSPFEIQAAILHAADELQAQAGRVAHDIELLSEKETVPIANPPPIPPQYAVVPDTAQHQAPSIPMLPLLGP